MLHTLIFVSGYNDDYITCTGNRNAGVSIGTNIQQKRKYVIIVFEGDIWPMGPKVKHIYLVGGLEFMDSWC